MKDLSRLLCLVALAGVSASAQSSRSTPLPTDPSLADVRTPTMTGQMKVQPVQPNEPIPAEDQKTTPGAEKPSAATSAKPQVEDVQLQASAIRPASEPRLLTRPNTQTVLPTATVLRLKLVRPISTATARPGEKFFATLTSPVIVDGQTVISNGTSVTCRVDSAHGRRRLGGKPSIAIRALSAQLPSGEVLEFSASVIDTATPRKLDVDQEGRIRGATFSPMDKVETGSLAGAGLIAGAVVAGPAGLFIGAGAGAAVGLGHSMVKHKDLTLPAGTELILQLDAPATSRAAAI